VGIVCWSVCGALSWYGGTVTVNVQSVFDVSCANVGASSCFSVSLERTVYPQVGPLDPVGGSSQHFYHCAWFPWALVRCIPAVSVSCLGTFGVPDLCILVVSVSCLGTFDVPVLFLPVVSVSCLGTFGVPDLCILVVSVSCLGTFDVFVLFLPVVSVSCLGTLGLPVLFILVVSVSCLGTFDVLVLFLPVVSVSFCPRNLVVGHLVPVQGHTTATLSDFTDDFFSNFKCCRFKGRSLAYNRNFVRFYRFFLELQMLPI
jgi:hypothetical protein